MKRSIAWFALIPITLLVGACGPTHRPVPPVIPMAGSGTVVTEERSVADFSEVSLTGAGQLLITHGPIEALTIEAEDNLLPLLRSEVQGGRLVLDVSESITPTRPIRFTVSARQLEGLRVDGGADVTISGIATDDFAVWLEGASRVRLSGRVERQSLHIAGAGTYEAMELTSRDATVQIDGAGMAMVNASESLRATINGMGTIEYAGAPDVEQSINGLGVVRRRADELSKQN